MSQKKRKEKERKKETPGWTDISGPAPVSFLSRSSMYYIMLTLHNPIKPLNIVRTVFLEDLILHLLLRVYKRPETAATCLNKRPEAAATCPNKQFRNNSLFSLPICQDEINKVVFV